MTAGTKGSALLQRRPVQWALLCGCWAFIAVFYTSQAGLQATYAGAPFAWWRVLRAELVYSFLWVVLTLAVLRLTSAFRWTPGNGAMSLLVHLGVSIVVSALHPMAMVGLMRLLGWGRDPSQPFWEVGKLSAVTAFHINLTFYWGILAVRYIVRNYHRYRERELRASQLEARLAQSQLQVLKMQLQPHFLFNTLNTISVLMAEDPRPPTHDRAPVRPAAQDPGQRRRQEVSLREEIDFLQGYLEIEKTRFHDRLTFRVAIEPRHGMRRCPAAAAAPGRERHPPRVSPRARPGPGGDLAPDATARACT